MIQERLAKLHDPKSAAFTPLLETLVKLSEPACVTRRASREVHFGVTSRVHTASMSKLDPRTLTRRDALRGLLTVTAASVVGCTVESRPDTSMADDASPTPDAHLDPDGGLDAGPTWDAGPAPTGAFQHGVASGDPWPQSVILWTRLSEASASTMLRWEVSEAPDFAVLVTSGMVEASPARDFTAKVEATGLEPGTTYYYRFVHAEMNSPIGRTRTAPEGAIDRLRFAVCSCASYAHGFFHGYRRIAERSDLDAVIFLGDYIYEYATGEYGRVRGYDPAHEILSLDDYRRRYRHYRLDRDLQEVHRQHPFISTWDDHETADNAYRDGAENHKLTEGAWAARLRAASDAYREWMPIREVIEGERLRLSRTLRYGDLVDLVVLDTRNWARDAQASGASDPTFNDPARTLLGADQEAWLLAQLEESPARWKVVCQQVMVAQQPFVLNTDQWDGYPAQRTRLFDFLAESTGGARDNVVVLTGDIHSSWASDLTPRPTDASAYTPATGEGALAVEFICPAITSPGLGPAVDRILRPRLATEAPHIKYVDLSQRGYIVLDVDATRAQAAWWHLADVTSIAGGSESLSATFETRAGANHLVASTMTATPRPDAPLPAPA